MKTISQKNRNEDGVNLAVQHDLFSHYLCEEQNG